MKILYISHSFGAWGSPDRIWDHNMRESLVQMEHELVGPPYDPNQAHIECSRDSSGKAREHYSQLLLDSVKTLLARSPLDLMFTYFDNRNVLPEAIDEIRRLGVLTVNFFCNAAHEFYKVDRVASHFDYCMVPERESLSKYRQVGARPIHIQMAANPDFYNPIDLPKVYDAVFVGTKYLNREEHLLCLSRAGMNVHVFGNLWLPYKPTLNDLPLKKIPRKLVSMSLWPLRQKLWEIQGLQLPYNHYHGPISDEEMISVNSQSRIVLGLSDVLNSSGEILRHIRLRDFEIPMCGAFYLTGYQEELAEYYEIGEEIECYNSLGELVDKAKYYLNHKDEREKIRLAGLARARREHTWQHRFSKLFNEIGLTKN